MLVEAATASPAGAWTVSPVRCRLRPAHKRCPGHTHVYREESSGVIEWVCPVCRASGSIAGWQATPWDLRAAPTAAPALISGTVPGDEILMQEMDLVVLTRDLPEKHLRTGDIGTVVLVHKAGAGYEVEFATLGGHTLAVLTVHAGDVRPVGDHEIAHARPVL